MSEVRLRIGIGTDIIGDRITFDPRTFLASRITARGSRPSGYVNMETFGSPNPFAEPPWYNSVNSPYYKDSHRRLRKFIREYVDEYIIPNCEQWEAQGHIPDEVSP